MLIVGISIKKVSYDVMMMFLYYEIKILYYSISSWIIDINGINYCLRVVFVIILLEEIFFIFVFIIMLFYRFCNIEVWSRS